MVPMAQAIHGGGLAESGDPAGGIEEMRRGLAGLRETGAEFGVRYLYSRMGEVCRRAERLDQALTATKDGMAVSERNEDRFGLPELHRVRGAVLLARSTRNRSRAEACFQDALAAARAQKAKSLELRAAMSLARLWSEAGKRDQARELLAPIYESFTEGFDTLDLVETKALLDELA